MVRELVMGERGFGVFLGRGGIWIWIWGWFLERSWFVEMFGGFSGYFLGVVGVVFFSFSFVSYCLFGLRVG